MEPDARWDRPRRASFAITKENTVRRLTLYTLVVAVFLPVVCQAQWATNGLNINNSNTGNVGIGTTTPTVKFDAGGWPGVPVDLSGVLSNFGGDAFFGNTGASVGRMRVASNVNQGFFQWNVYYNGAALKSIDNAKPGFEIDMEGISDSMIFRRYPAGSGALAAPTSLLTLTGAGNVGIGTGAPAFKLDVVGAIHATQVIGATYQDVAEWVPATSRMAPGTVVVLNLEAVNEVMPSHGAYDTTVAGVVSENPGVLLGVAADTKAQIATTGRVRVRADASSLPIRVGDLLVTSARTGMAMRSEPVEIQGRKFHQPGTIIGKALEPLPTGDGAILVLLSMQ